MKITENKKVFSTGWFDVLAKKVEGGASSEPFYSLGLSDYVSVVALTDRQELLLVRQYRPAIEASVWELPSGHHESHESPFETAQRELLEETGYVSKEWQPLGFFWPDTGRLSNRLWCYFAGDARRASGAHAPEAGLEVSAMPIEAFWHELWPEGFQHALHVACLWRAVAAGRVPPPLPQPEKKCG